MFVFTKVHCTDYFAFAMKFADTKNELTEEVGGYQHVVVLQNMKVVDGDLVDVLKQIPRGTVSGDCIQHINRNFCSYVSVEDNALLSIPLSFYNRLLAAWKCDFFVSANWTFFAMFHSSSKISCCYHITLHFFFFFIVFVFVFIYFNFRMKSKFLT